MPLLVAMILAATLPATAQENQLPAQAPLLPPIDSQSLAGRILFAFGDEGLLLPPSLIAKDGSLAEVRIDDKDLGAGVPSVLSLLFPTGTVYGLGVVHGVASPKGLTLDGQLSIVPGSSFVLADGLVVAAAGSMVVRIDRSKFSFAKLGDVAVLASISVGGGALDLKGTLDDGTYDGGSVSLEGRLSLVSDFEKNPGAGDTVKVKLAAGGTLDVVVRKGALMKAVFAGIPGEIDIVVPDSESPLRLGGSLGGKYENGSLDLDASLRVMGDFTYRRDAVTVTLNSGHVKVTVRSDQLRHAELQGIEAVVDVMVEGRPLRLAGSITNGSYKPSQGISFTGELKLEAPFVYRKDPVTATLNSGEVQVTVKDDLLRTLELQGVDAVVDIVVEGRPLELAGSISDGSYKPGEGISFTAELELDAPFVYHRGTVTATLQPGPATVQLHQSKKKHWVMVRQGKAPVLKIDLDDDDDDK